MPILLILADDLTGALDTGVQFAKRGIPTRVYPSPVRETDPAGEEPEVLVINTNTRHHTPDGSRRIIRDLAYRYRHIRYLYKKTDSTLRGHIGAELEALMEGADIRRLPFIPAYPNLERTTREGRQLLRGIPVDQTEMAADALNPVTCAFIPGIIRKESELPVRLIPPIRPNSNPPEPEPGNRRDILVFDCSTNEEMGEIAGYLKERKLLRGSAGCAGFAEALMDVLPFSGPRGIALEFSENPGRGTAGTGPERPETQAQTGALPILVLSGSRHPLSVAQVQAALAGGIAGLSVSGEELVREEWFSSPEGEALIHRCAGVLGEEGIVVLGTRAAMGIGKEELEERAPRGGAGEHENVAGCLGRLVGKIRERTGPLDLVIFGGDTLLGTMAALEFEYIIPIMEIRAGIVLARGEGPGGKALIAAKSGAFGDLSAIETIRDFLRSPDTPGGIYYV
jgi:uncharacterized protein YgbK (DUF1537 family)